MAGNGTQHHKVHGLTGGGLIIGLPFALCSAVGAITGRTQGFIDWLSNPVGGIGLLAFFTAAIWYCKLEFDEVVMDYFDGGTRSFSLLANKIVACVVWAMTAFTIIKLAFLG